MKLYLIFKKEDQDEEIYIKFADQKLEISQQKNDWNNEKINNFLIALASKTPLDENIELIFDENIESELYLHLVDLFSIFVKEFNDKVNSKEEKNGI